VFKKLVLLGMVVHAFNPSIQTLSQKNKNKNKFLLWVIFILPRNASVKMRRLPRNQKVGSSSGGKNITLWKERALEI
jgi:hypothetical protein